MTHKDNQHRKFGDARRAPLREARWLSQKQLVQEVLTATESEWRKKYDFRAALRDLLPDVDAAIDKRWTHQPDRADSLKLAAYRFIHEAYGRRYSTVSAVYTELNAHLFAWARWLRENLAKLVLKHLTDPTECLAAAYLAAIVYGGLLNPNTHREFGRRILEHAHFSGLHLRVELSNSGDDANTDQHLEPVQWFPPAFCCALIWNAQQVWGSVNKSRQVPRIKTLRRLAREWVQKLTSTESQFKHLAKKTPERLYQLLLDAVRLDLAAHTPAILAEAACGKVAHVSLPKTTWQRLETRSPLLASQPEATYIPPAPSQPQSTSLSRISVKQQLKKLLSVCARQTQTLDSRKNTKGYLPERRRRLAKDLREHLEKGTFGHGLVALVAAWAYFLATNRSRYNRYLEPKTIHDYCSLVARALMENPHAHHLAERGQDELLNIYRRALKTVDGETLREALASRLLDFHDFLSEYWPLEPIDPWTLDPSLPKRVTRVKANLLAPWEYHAAFDWIAAQTHLPERERLACTVLLIVLYRSGARLREVLWLPINHLRIETDDPRDCCVYVKNTEERQTKTKNAPRAVPLLLVPDEHNLIVSLLRLREGDPGAKDSDPLFTEFDATSDFLVRIYRVVRQALLTATGDPDVTVHTLRHTHISYCALWAMRANDIDHDPFDFDGWAAGTPAASQTFHAAILRKRAPTTETLRVLARMAGHGHPETTIHSYTHVLDWLTHEYLEQNNPPLIDQEMAAFLPLNGSAVAQYRGRKGDNKCEYRGLVPWVWRNRKPYRAPKSPARPATPKVEGHASARPVVVSFRTIAWALQALHTQPVAVVARHLGRTPEEVEVLMRVADEIAERTHYEYYTLNLEDGSAGASAREYRPPRNHILRDACSRIERRQQTSDANSEIRAIMSLWLKYYRAGHSGLYLPTVELAVVFAGFLRSLSLGEYLRLVETSTVQKNLSRSQSEAPRRQWTQATRIEKVCTQALTASGVIVRIEADGPAIVVPGISVARVNGKGQEVSNFRSLHDALFLANVYQAWREALAP